MKKITLLAAVIVVASFASCKKVYTCTCTYSYNNTSYSDTYSTGVNVKKKTAETWCAGYQSTGETCTLN